jgi:hypothetical protein
MTDVERMRDALQEMVDAFDYIPLTGDFERRRAARAKAQTALHSPERSAARSEGELERLLRSDDGQPVRIHPDGSISPIDAAEFDANVERLKPCEHCRSEGRIIRVVSRHWGLEPKEEDCGECPVCEGDGMELIEVESIDLDDLCRNGGCQYGMAPEYTCRHECQYKRADSKQETVSDERDGAVAERSAARSEHISPERRRGLEEAARIAENGCLVPPDGGSPTEGERLMCEDIAKAIRALIPPSSEGGSPR